MYKHYDGVPMGIHAVRILGWGTEGGTPYWLVANSWNRDWGDNGELLVLSQFEHLILTDSSFFIGFFKIIRGKNDVNIESGVVAGLPKRYSL